MRSVKIINPFGELVDRRPDLKSDKWNPLDDLNPSDPDYEDELMSRTDAMISSKPNENNPFFTNAARSAMTGGSNYDIRYARTHGGLPPYLPRVRHAFAQEAEKLERVVRQMLATGDPSIASRVAKFLNDNRETEAIKSTIEVETSWMTPIMCADMQGKGGVNFRVIKQRPTTIYIVVPAKELINKAAYLRLVLASALRSCYRPGGVPVTLLVEEAFVLRHLEVIEQACSILRGYKGRLVTVFQSLQQAKKLYAETYGLLGGGAVVAFRPGHSDMETAEWMVKKAGKETIPVKSVTAPSSFGQFAPSRSYQQQIRDRIPLHKIFGMPNGIALVWLPGEEKPRISKVKGYFELPLNRLADANPYFHGGA